jgi:hypothetical protein
VHASCKRYQCAGRPPGSGRFKFPFWLLKKLAARATPKDGEQRQRPAQTPRILR